MRVLTENSGFFISDILKGHSVRKYYKKFKIHQYLNPEEIERIQVQKFISLLDHAYQFSSFYRKRLQSINAFPQDFKDKVLISKIPPLTRTDLNNHWKEIVSEKYKDKKLLKGSSSGSTGIPVIYFKDNEAISAGQAAVYLGWSMGGWKLGMKGLHIWGNPTTVKNEWARVSSKMKARVFNQYKFPAYRLSEKNELLHLVQILKNGKFDFIDGYTNAIFTLANLMKSSKLALESPLKIVLTTAETLQDYQREAISHYLGPVHDVYGCSEINGIANECRECGKYHIIDTHALVEFGDVVDEYNNRELFITDLDNYAFPFIRYQNDDNGIPASSEGSCSIKFSRINRISGRRSDIISLPDGGTLSVPSFFGSMLLKKIKGINKYQIEKDRADHLKIKLAVSSEFKEKEIDILNQNLNLYLKDLINWDIEFVDEIPISKSGKFKIVVDKTIN